MIRGRSTAALLLVGVLVANPSLAALPAPATQQRADLDIDQLQHTAYGAAEGAPNYLANMWQDQNGFLWVSDGDSLARFDGVRFDHPYEKLLSGYAPISGQLVDQQGNLWLGHVGGGVTMIAVASVQHTDPGQNGLPDGSVFGFVQDNLGIIWGISVGGVVRWVHGSWQPAGINLGYPGKHPENLFKIASTGNIYLQDAAGNYVLRPGAKRFVLTHEDIDRLQFPLPATITWSFNQMTDGDALVDRGGSLWVVGNSGIDRLRWSGSPPGKLPPRIEHFGHSSGLTADSANNLFEDREGDIWVSTTKGLDRFSVTTLTPITLPGNVNLPLIATTVDGDVWLANLFQSPLSLHGTVATAHAEWSKGGDSAIYADADGLWMAGELGLRHRENGRVETIPAPAELAHAGTRYRAITRDAHGCVWIAIATYGVYRIVDGQWQAGGGRHDLPPEIPSFLTHDSQGRIWLAYRHNRLAIVDDSKLAFFTKADGLTVGDVGDVSFRDDHAWITGTKGVALLEHGRFRRLNGEGEDFSRSTGIAETAHGDLWISGSRGIFRIDRMALSQWRKHPERAVAFTRFDAHDGVDGLPTTEPVPSMIQAANGRLWFSTNGGISFVDPDHVLRNNIAPQPVIQTMTADGQEYAIRKGLVLPPLTQQIRIKFTAPSLRMPDRIRLQYRIEGFDTLWQDAGPQREANYTHLAPGNYRFTVRAFNENGVASVEPAQFQFVLAPAWYQTWWFRVACLLAFIVLLWLLHRWQVRLARSHERATQNGRSAERERIARDLHDTLLQGVQGMLLQVQTSISSETSPERALKLRDAVDRARASVVEARDKVASLRGETDDDFSLSSSLGELGRDLASTCSTQFILLAEGHEKCLRTCAREQIFLIGSELLRNAFIHGEARQVRLRIACKRSELLLSVHDDGRGIDPDILAAGGRTGHWGFVGVRERTGELKGKLKFQSRTGSTLITLSVPGAVVYRQVP